MKFSYNWLQSFFSKPLPKPKDLAELLTMHSFEVEQVLPKSDDYMLDIDILPNRAHDCLSHFGVAREIAAVTGLPITRINANKKANQRESGDFKVEISNNELCPRYVAYVIEGIKIAESPDWIRERLASVGQKSINNIVDITNYVIWELGQPLHGFDFDKIKDHSVNIRISKPGEKLETLDGAIHDLGDGAIIIEDSGRIIDLAGIKGGANTQIDKNTKKIIFQAAIFDPSHIRRTSQKLNIRTEASVRYMHGFDQELPPHALERAVELLKETNPDAKIVQKIDIYPNPERPKKIELNTDYANSLLGTNLSRAEIDDILKRLNLSSVIPSYRLDLNIQEDLIEEIGRIYGYENIKPESPRGVLIAPRRNEQVFWRSKAREVLAGFGFSEAYNCSLISTSPPTPLLIKEKGERGEVRNGYGSYIELANPVSDEFRYLRSLLLPGILKNIESNSKYFHNIKIFEIGKVFEENSEKENIIIASTDGFYEIKGCIDEFLKKLGITDFYFDPALSDDDEKSHGHLLHPARRANIFIDNNLAGFIGEAHPALLSKFGIKAKVYCAEFNFDKISAAAREEHIYQKPSKYPEVVRDIAVLVPRGTMVVEVLNAINGVSGPLLRDVDLFDMFEGKNLPVGMKNLAFHLLFQSYERTLTSQEVDEIMGKITKILDEKSWKVR